MSTASTSTARARAFQLVARDRGARGANRRAGGVMWARRAARVLAAGARMTPAVPRWGIAPDQRDGGTLTPRCSGSAPRMRPSSRPPPRTAARTPTAAGPAARARQIPSSGGTHLRVDPRARPRRRRGGAGRHHPRPSPRT